MSVALIVAAIVVWYAIGVGGFVYWWTSDHDLGMGDAAFALFEGIFGPFTWVIGWIIHGEHPRRVLVRRRV